MRITWYHWMCYEDPWDCQSIAFARLEDRLMVPSPLAVVLTSLWNSLINMVVKYCVQGFGRCSNRSEVLNCVEEKKGCLWWRRRYLTKLSGESSNDMDISFHQPFPNNRKLSIECSRWVSPWSRWSWIKCRVHDGGILSFMTIISSSRIAKNMASHTTILLQPKNREFMTSKGQIRMVRHCVCCCMPDQNSFQVLPPFQFDPFIWAFHGVG